MTTSLEQEGRLLVVIPARSGSKGIVNKNILEVEGKPLIMHTYERARMELKDVDCDILISTDSDEYIRLLLSWGVAPQEIAKRPEFLSEDSVTDLPVAIYVLAEAERRSGREYKHLMWLRPTSPFREDGLLLEALRLLQEDQNCTAVRSFKKPDEHPYRMWEFKSDRCYVDKLMKDVVDPFSWPRQKLPKDYLFQTGDVEVCRRETLQGGSMYGDRVRPLMITCSSIDIDETDDLKRTHR